MLTGTLRARTAAKLARAAATDGGSMMPSLSSFLFSFSILAASAAAAVRVWP